MQYLGDESQSLKETLEGHSAKLRMGVSFARETVTFNMLGIAPARLGHHFQLGPVLVEIAQRRQRHLRLARLAVAKDDQASGRNALRSTSPRETGAARVCSRACRTERVVSRLVGIAEPLLKAY